MLRIMSVRGWVTVAIVVLAALASRFGLAASGDFAELTDALGDANLEIRTSVFPALAAVFGGVVLISIAALVVSVLRRGN